ncbi:MAG: site-specific DNA-methyltransferase [Myxococcota bacterium]|nr:site-specific DNA-methyltransferase [Myxococcota bacterium]
MKPIRILAPHFKDAVQLQWSGKKPLPLFPPLPIRTLEQYGSRPSAHLYWGENLDVLEALLPKYANTIDLIYIDPPFDSSGQYTKKISLYGEKPRKENSFEQIQYSDLWKEEAYLQFMFERLLIFREFLSERGSLYLHCDMNRSHKLRVILDEVFGAKNCLNHLIWGYKTGGIPQKYGFSKKHDDILLYVKGREPIFNPTRQKSYAASLPEPHTTSGKKLGVLRDPECDLCHNGSPGQKYRNVRCRDVWSDIPTIFRNDAQRVYYPTQKPEGLLQRIVETSSEPNSLVMDAFSGSGTCVTVASKLHRRAIGIDSNLEAILTTRGRLRRSNIACSIHTTCQTFDHSSPNSFRSIAPLNRPINPSDRYRYPDIKPTPRKKDDIHCQFDIKRRTLFFKGINSPKLQQQFPKNRDPKRLVQSITLDFSGVAGIFMNPILDQPRQTQTITGTYPIPEHAKTVRIRVIDLLCNVFECMLAVPHEG